MKKQFKKQLCYYVYGQLVRGMTIMKLEFVTIATIATYEDINIALSSLRKSTNTIDFQIFYSNSDAKKVKKTHNVFFFGLRSIVGYNDKLESMYKAFLLDSLKMKEKIVNNKSLLLQLLPHNQ